MEGIVHFSGFISLQTRILVTHGLTHLPDCDRVIVMHEGQIVESGTYDELMVNDGKLKEIMKSQENASSEGIYSCDFHVLIIKTNTKNHASFETRYT